MHLLSVVSKRVMCILVLTNFADLVSSKVHINKGLSVDLKEIVCGILTNSSLHGEAQASADLKASELISTVAGNRDVPDSENKVDNVTTIIRAHRFHRQKSVCKWIKRISSDIQLASGTEPSGVGVAYFLRSRRLNTLLKRSIYVIIVLKKNTTHSRIDGATNTEQKVSQAPSAEKLPNMHTLVNNAEPKTTPANGSYSVLQSEIKENSNLEFLPEANEETDHYNLESKILSKLKNLVGRDVCISKRAHDYAETKPWRKAYRDLEFLIFESGVLQPRTTFDEAIKKCEYLDSTVDILTTIKKKIPFGDIKVAISLELMKCQHLVGHEHELEGVLFQELRIVLHLSETASCYQPESGNKRVHIIMTPGDVEEASDIYPKLNYTALANAVQPLTYPTGDGLTIKEAYSKEPYIILSFVLLILEELRTDMPLKFGAIAQFLAEDTKRKCHGTYMRFSKYTLKGKKNFKKAIKSLEFDFDTSTEMDDDSDIDKAYKKPQVKFTVGFSIVKNTEYGDSYDLQVVFYKSVAGANPNPAIFF